MCKQHTFTFNEFDENTPTIEAYIIREKPNTRPIMYNVCLPRHRLKLIHYRLKLISTLLFRLKPTFAPRFSVKTTIFPELRFTGKNKQAVITEVIRRHRKSLARPEEKSTKE